MTALLFLASLAAIFAVVIVIEADSERGPRLQRPAGLLTWITSGNWPAKIGGALVVVGVGALLRYAFSNIEIDPQLKLAAGVVIALALGLVSLFLPEGPNKRAVSLALNGAAFGVAYLTAYSSFGLFNYLSSPKGLALLAITSAAAGVFAVTRSALSLALLSMVGAYLAPAFAVGDPGPKVVYGYYLFASLLTLAMVTLRGWRPLIHLSFVSTLAGGAFFAWTADYFTAAHAKVMLPMVLALSAVHVAMPILEGGRARGPWLERLDVVYMLGLPAFAALLVVGLAPNRVDLAVALVSLGIIWALAAVALKFATRAGAAVHAVIAVVLVALGAAAWFGDLPWELILLAFAVGALAIAAWRVAPTGRLHSVLAGIVLLFGAIHALNSIAADDVTAASFGSEFVKRIIAAALLIAAGVICRRIGQALDTLLLAIGIVWVVIAIGIEVISWDLASFTLFAHWVLLLLGASLWIPGRRLRFADRNVAGLAVAILATAAWASSGASATAAWITLPAAVLVLIGMAVRPRTDDGDTTGHRLWAALLAPAAAAVWAIKAGSFAGIEVVQFGLAAATVVAIATLLLGRMLPAERDAWLEGAAEIFGASFATLLGFSTLLAIVRNPWAIALEVLCLAGLALVTWMRHSRQRPIELLTATCMIGLALILQASLMRVLGPPGDLDITDVLRLQLSAVVSLLWAIAGMGLTLWSRKIGSRTLWVSGAILLVASAAKLLLIDFGSLGQLGNILAVIAAGVVFLLVGWLAPMPPARAEREPGPRSDEDAQATHKRNAWTIAILLMVGSTLLHNPRLARDFIHLQRAESSAPRFQAQPPRAVTAVPQEAPASDESVEPEVEPESQEASAESEPEAESEAASMPEGAASEPELASDPEADREEWKPPPVVDASGVRAYTQYSAPHLRGATSTQSSSEAPPAPAAQEQGLDQLLREGRIRRATQRDFDAWVVATGIDRKNLSMVHLDPQSGNQFLFRTFVVQRPMTFPAGLHGAHLATFIVPRNVPKPYGDRGHSQVLEMP
jgi:uncharacterized membrane protein